MADVVGEGGLKEYRIDGKTYRLAGGLSDFQLGIYVHLVDWKRRHLADECGTFKYKGSEIPYDVLLPESMQGELQPIYRPVLDRLLQHQQRFPFKLHKFVGHMASSQVACINLFVPIMTQPDLATEVLSTINPDIVSIATDQLDNGFRIEFWDEDPNGPDDQAGMLGDHNRSTGTDSDFAIAYRNHAGQLCLWLIEHKLTEAEFTTCGGAKSKGCKLGNYSCDCSADILANPALCYYHGKCHYNYWPITLANEATFPRDNLLSHTGCPFKGGMNQLWRNTVLALAIENATDGPYAKFRKVYFSVCHHPGNKALNESMAAFRVLLGEKGRFSSFTSEPLVSAARKSGNAELVKWADWYSELYMM
jgi:hypothetical protein